MAPCAGTIIARFSVKSTQGTNAITITDISKTGHVFDPDNSVLTSSIQ